VPFEAALVFALHVEMTEERNPMESRLFARQAVLTFALVSLALIASWNVAISRAANPTNSDKPVEQQDATPTTSSACDLMATPAVGMDHGAMGNMSDLEFDQLYIDMMIPHHEAIIAMAEAAQTMLTDERLLDIAAAIIATQTPEIAELRDYREHFYGSADPTAIDVEMMDIMEQAMPGMGSMEEVAFQMDAATQVAAICAAEEPNLTFIDLTIAHHEMAIASSEMALEQATHPEIQDFAQRVIEAQQQEIDTLTEIRAELTGEATPTA
jgi:uncharacterized protein (DUF305 family)